jgi:hypothetical protein
MADKIIKPKGGEAGSGKGLSGALIRPKKSGETKIVLVTDWNDRHNGVAVELAVRNIFKAKHDWRIVAVRDTNAFTPALLADADLLIANRGGDADPFTLAEGRIVETPKMGASFWTPETAATVIENVRNRGMGLLALHAAADCGRADILRLLDFVPVMPGGPQPVWVRNLNGTHPVTAGIGKFSLRLDEQIAGVLRSPDTVILFETTGILDKRESVGGWCRTEGKGRVAVLLPGHATEAFEAPEYRTIIWRAAHWAMGREVAKYPEEKNMLY